MKIKVTKKSIREEHFKIIKIGYCEAQYLLKFEEPFAYSTRAEGWACDYYAVNDVLISTGYAPLESKNTYVDYSTIRKFEEMAREVACDYKLTYEEQKEEITHILHKFIEVCKS